MGWQTSLHINWESVTVLQRERYLRLSPADVQNLLIRYVFPVGSHSWRSRNKSSSAKTFLLLSFLSLSPSLVLVRFVSFHPSRALWQTQFPTLVCPFRLIVDRGLSNGSNKQYGDQSFKSTPTITCGSFRYLTLYSLNWKTREIERRFFIQKTSKSVYSIDYEEEVTSLSLNEPKADWKPRTN